MKTLYPTQKRPRITPKTARALAILSCALAAVIVDVFPSEWAMAVSTLLIAAGLAQWLVFNRCPHCGQHLGRSGGKFCPHCGKALDGTGVTTTRTERACGKLNLTLDILGKRPDGYHEMRMVMQTVSLHDEVTVTLTDSEGISCRIEGAALPCDERNLAVKAARAFCEALDFAPEGICIELTKRIPSEAGMAGGSADAAAVLRALRSLCAPKMTDEQLEEIGAKVGSDVPFCVVGGTQLAEGRGEVLTRWKDAPHLYAALCKPDFSISTPALFSRADSVTLTERPDERAMLRAIDAGDAAGVCASVGNVFEQVLAGEQAAQVAEIKRALLAHGAEAAAMTGSGSVVYGLFREEVACKAACAALADEKLRIFCAEFC